MKKLERKQLKTLKGGVAAGGGTCQAQDGDCSVFINLSKDQAQSISAQVGGHWCCDSCCTATWAVHTGCPQTA